MRKRRSRCLWVILTKDLLNSSSSWKSGQKLYYCTLQYTPLDLLPKGVYRGDGKVYTKNSIILNIITYFRNSVEFLVLIIESNKSHTDQKYKAFISLKRTWWEQISKSPNPTIYNVILIIFSTYSQIWEVNSWPFF